MKNFKAFTLVEVIMCIVLTSIVVSFIYIMIFSAQRSYFKLASVTKQRNDIRYFENFLRNSALNAQEFVSIGTQLKFKYYDSNKNKYRIDEYDFKGALEEDSNLSNIEYLKNNAQIEEEYKNTPVTVTITVFQNATSYDSAEASSPTINNEVVLENVNKVFWRIKSEDDPKTVPILDLGIVYNKELDDGEVNYEYMIYKFAMKNLHYMDLD